jgi:hypothetical protein
MPPVAIDLTLSDDEDDVVHTGGMTMAAQAQVEEQAEAIALCVL